MAYVPPVVELPGAREVSADNGHGLPILVPGDGVGERHGGVAADRRLNLTGAYSRKRRPALATTTDVSPVLRNSVRSLACTSDVEVHHRSGDGRGDDHGKQRGRSASAGRSTAARISIPDEH